MKQPIAHNTRHTASLCSDQIAKATLYVRKLLGVIGRCGLKLKRENYFYR